MTGKNARTGGGKIVSGSRTAPLKPTAGLGGPPAEVRLGRSEAPQQLLEQGLPGQAGCVHKSQKHIGQRGCAYVPVTGVLSNVPGKRANKIVAMDLRAGIRPQLCEPLLDSISERCPP